MKRSGWAVLLTLTVLGAATIYEAAVALGVLDLGSLPGEGPPGSGIAGVCAALGLISAAVVAAALVGIRNPTPLAALLAPAAAAFLVARFYTFDSYYLPTMIRLSERDFLPPVVVFSLAGLAIAAGILVRARPSLGLALSAPLILICALAAGYSGIGH
jgi:hypothetical protein